MSNDVPNGDEPTRAYQPITDGPSSELPFDEPEATRLEHSVPRYDPEREPASNPYASASVAPERSGVAAQLVLVGLICLAVGLGLGYLLFNGGGNDTSDTSTTSTILPTTEMSTTEAPTTASTAASSTTEEVTTTTRPTTTSTRPTTTSTRPTTASTAAPVTSTPAATDTE